MLTLSSDLTAHQKGTRTKPALSVTVEGARFAVPILRLAGLADTSGDGDCQLSLAVDSAAPGNLLAVRVNGTALDYQADYPNTAAWTNLDTISAGQGFQLAWDEVNSLFGLAYGDGNDVKFRTSANGSSWSSATTIVTEASAIGAVALAFDDVGDACVFYVLGTSTTLKRLRRTSGTWAASGTNWSRSGSVANLTGLSAVWHADYVLAITGNEVTTIDRRLWCAEMGDTFFPTNAWSTLKTIAEADTASGVTFSYPSICEIESVYFVAFQRDEANDVSTSRAFVTHAMPTAGPLGWWSEPRPVPGVTTTHGAALAYAARGAGTHATAWLAGPRRAFSADFYDKPDLSSRTLALSWKLTPDSLRVRLELDDRDGNATGEGPTTSPLQLGDDLVIAHGYTVGTPPAAEYGATLRANVRKISRLTHPGKSRLIVEADGPWEALDRFRSMDAWTAPTSTTRGAIFQRVAALAGIEVGEASGDRAPSTAWSTDAPAFAIAANEKGSTTLRRLLEVTPDFIRPAFGSGTIEVCSFTDTDIMEQYQLPALDYGLMQLLEAEWSDELAPNWVRLQGPDRYADAFDDFWGLDDQTDILALGPMGFTVRDTDADDDTKRKQRPHPGAAARQPRPRDIARPRRTGALRYRPHPHHRQPGRWAGERDPSRHRHRSGLPHRPNRPRRLHHRVRPRRLSGTQLTGPPTANS